jgi:hypothetical protein
VAGRSGVTATSSEVGASAVTSGTVASGVGVGEGSLEHAARAALASRRSDDQREEERIGGVAFVGAGA